MCGTFEWNMEILNFCMETVRGEWTVHGASGWCFIFNYIEVVEMKWHRVSLLPGEAEMFVTFPMLPIVACANKGVCL